uniref:CX domain-containing protein n=1 Tax=Romanomermis culicivorax TaxID=13658 RepID=A0A915L8C7_ROMCU
MGFVHRFGYYGYPGLLMYRTMPIAMFIHRPIIYPCCPFIYYPLYHRHYFYGYSNYNERFYNATGDDKPVSDAPIVCRYNITDDDPHFNNVTFENGTKVEEIVYECDADSEYCCDGLDCCKREDQGWTWWQVYDFSAIQKLSISKSANALKSFVPTVNGHMPCFSLRNGTEQNGMQSTERNRTKGKISFGSVGGYRRLAVIGCIVTVLLCLCLCYFCAVCCCDPRGVVAAYNGGSPIAGPLYRSPVASPIYDISLPRPSSPIAYPVSFAPPGAPIFAQQQFVPMSQQQLLTHFPPYLPSSGALPLQQPPPINRTPGFGNFSSAPSARCDPPTQYGMPPVTLKRPIGFNVEPDLPQTNDELRNRSEISICKRRGATFDLAFFRRKQL